MRVAVKVPSIERNPTGFSSSTELPTKIAFPEIVLSEVNLPLRINVPISRQHVPMGNSTSPEKFTRSSVASDQAADRGSATDFPSGPVSRSRIEPEPLA